MAKPVVFKTFGGGKEPLLIEDALKAVSFPVGRNPISFIDNHGKKQTIHDREVIYRTDTGEPFDIFSSGYKIIKHEDALSAAVTAFKSNQIPFELKSVGLDRNGARLLARFQFTKDYVISSGVDTKSGKDTIRPELTITNSYDGGTALGVDLGSERLVCLNLATAKISDANWKWMHLGNQADPEKIRIAAVHALKSFETSVVPQYQSMAQQEISKDIAIRAVIAAIKHGEFPKRLGKFAVHCVESDAALRSRKALKRSVWTLFNALTWTTTHSFQGSPSRARDIQTVVANLFKDHGKKLLAQAKAIDDKELVIWMAKIEDLEEDVL